MIVAVDERVPYWQAAFGAIGDLRPFKGRELKPAHVRDADALIVRSITPVNADLLDGSRVRFLATASVGTDHVDTAYLASRGIRFANAAGSNANSVAQYVVAALLYIAGRRGWGLNRMSLGIVGVGHIGSVVEKYARVLGMQVFLCDPPLRETTGDNRYGYLQDVLGADILTFHVPLTSSGSYPTRHMVNHRFLERLTPRQFLINTSRGSVFQGRALKEIGFDRRRIAGAVLDVWEGEPWIDHSLLDLTDIGTSHIAGFSLDGKIRGVEMIVEELCNFLGIPMQWQSQGLYPAPRRIRPTDGPTVQEAMRSVVLQAYDIMQDDARLRQLKTLTPENGAAGFDRLRDEYFFRPEFHHFVVELEHTEDNLAGCLARLGFHVSRANSIVR